MCATPTTAKLYSVYYNHHKPVYGPVNLITVYNFVLGKNTDEELCPICGKGEDTGGPMVGCDKCFMWLHWACAGITAAPAADDWYCATCVSAI